jgi:hypothetical protein
VEISASVFFFGLPRLRSSAPRLRIEIDKSSGISGKIRLPNDDGLTCLARAFSTSPNIRRNHPARLEATQQSRRESAKIISFPGNTGAALLEALLK